MRPLTATAKRIEFESLMVLFGIIVEAVWHIISYSLLTPETCGKTTEKRKKKKDPSALPSDDKIEKN